MTSASFANEPGKIPIIGRRELERERERERVRPTGHTNTHIIRATLALV